MLVLGFYALFAVTFVTLCRLIAPAEGWRARAFEIGTPVVAGALCWALAPHFANPSRAMVAAAVLAFTGITGLMRPYQGAVMPAYFGNSEGARVAIYAGGIVIAGALLVSAATGIDFFRVP